MESEQRYTISKLVADELQMEGWKLIEEYYNDELQCDIYHLTRDKE